MVENGTVHGLMVINTDITESKHFERELSETVTQQQQGMGRQLHDDLGQQLVGARLIAKGLQQTLEACSLPESTRAGELVAALSGAENRVRELIKGVRPVEVDANGLMAALDDLAGSARRLSNIRCSFTCDEPVLDENSHTATQLFYIASEAVQNSVKHALAEHITIGLNARNDHLRLWVADDGIGMPAQGGGGAGMGLRIMRHRASVIGAELRFDGPHQGGTRVTCILPLEPSE
jgi:two-component system sensor kinase FixL